MKKRWLIPFVVVFLAAGGSTAGAAYHYGQDDRLPAGFSVAGWRAGGQSAAQTLVQVQQRMSALEQTEVRPMLPDGLFRRDLGSLTLKQLGMQVKAEEAIQALESYRDQGWWQRVKHRLRGEDSVSYDLSVTWDDTALQTELGKAWGTAAGSNPIDAKRKITALDEIVYTPEVAGSQVDLSALSADIKKLAPATLVQNNDKSKSVTLPVIAKLPPVTVASLKEEGIERKIAEFTTSFATSAAGRSHNVTAAAKALNETLLQPGETFEYGKIVDKADHEYGYRMAPVIVNGKLTPGIGGGICQVSSTLYNAVLQAGVDVVERRNHSLAVHYLPQGLDAAFADGYIDFRFRNSTGKQLLIRTVVQDKRLTVKLFGTLPENVSYRMETRQIKVLPPNTKYVGNDKLELGTQKQLEKGQPGYVVDSFRIKLIDGKPVSREKLPRSSYRSQDELIAVHPTDPRLKPQPPIPARPPVPAQHPATLVEPV